MTGSRVRALACWLSVARAVAPAALLHSGAGVAAPPPAGMSPFGAPFDTDLRAATDPAAANEHLTVTGRLRRTAPVPDNPDEATPWDAARLIRDPRTGTDTTAFGNAFNLGDPLGSDERSNETGGALVAPRHP